MSLRVPTRITLSSARPGCAAATSEIATRMASGRREISLLTSVVMTAPLGDGWLALDRFFNFPEDRAGAAIRWTVRRRADVPPQRGCEMLEEPPHRNQIYCLKRFHKFA